MATRIEIARDLRQTFGCNALTKSQVGQYFGWKGTQTYTWLQDVPFIRVGEKGKKYLVIDLARKIEYYTT